MQTNNLITSGSQLNWQFSNKSTERVKLNSLQLIDGSTGSAGNIMSVNKDVEANTSVAYTTTIGAAGIHVPVTCRFRYTYNGSEYSTDAVYSGGSGFIDKYTLSIKATGNGQVTYRGNTIRNTTKSFSVEMLSSETLTFTPDKGYQIKSVKVNNSDVTRFVSNNSYIIRAITSNQSVEVEFEAIPATTYNLTIIAKGNGSVSYDGKTVRDMRITYTVNKGTSASFSFSPDNGYQIKSVKVNGSTVTYNNNKYTISSINGDTTFEVEFEAIPIPTYTLTITAVGNGSASYNGTTIRSKTSSFTVNEGSSATVSFSSDNCYQIKNVKVNGSTVSVSNNQYTISNIKRNTTVEVEFEAIPTPTYSLSIKSIGNGSVSYSGTTIRNRTSSFTVNEGSSATISFSPDDGYRIKSVLVNNSDVTSYIWSNKYTITSISKNTTVEVEFEAVGYTLSITSAGNGSASYNGTTIRSKTSSFTVNEGASATITFTPDKGYQIKSVKVNNSAVSVSNNQYTVKNITSNTTVSVEFEVIPPKTYTLSITASGNGSATYNSTTIRSKTSSFTVNEGTSAVISFSPDSGNRIKSVKVNNAAVTVTNNLYMIYTIKEITSNTTVSVEFESTAPTTYTLSITASGNGSASYNSTTIRSKTSSFTVNAGTSATISFSPDNGYRIKEVRVNNSTVTVSNNQYTIKNISTNTTVSVEFEAITYTLSITALGNGSASYNGTTVRNKTSSFTVNAGTSATISFSPDNGYKIKRVLVNNSNVTSGISNNTYTVSNISKNTSVEVEFEENPPSVYKLTYIVDGEAYKVYEIEEGATITPEPEPKKEGYKFSGWSYIPSKMPAEDVVVTGRFIQEGVVINGVLYQIAGNNSSAIHADNANGEIKIEESVVINGQTYQVTTIAEDAFQGCTGLTSVEIPNTITTIEENAFNGCSGLLIIKIGKGVKEIGSKAFANIARNAVRTRADNTGLKVYCEAEAIPSTAADAFENSPIDKGTLIVKDEMVMFYKYIVPWNGFGSIVGLSTGINSATIDTEDSHFYDIQGNRLDDVRKGVNIIRTRDGKTKKLVVK